MNEKGRREDGWGVRDKWKKLDIFVAIFGRILMELLTHTFALLEIRFFPPSIELKSVICIKIFTFSSFVGVMSLAGKINLLIHRIYFIRIENIFW